MMRYTARLTMSNTKIILQKTYKVSTRYRNVYTMVLLS